MLFTNYSQLGNVLIRKYHLHIKLLNNSKKLVLRTEFIFKKYFHSNMTLNSFQIQIINLVYSVNLGNLIKMQKCQSKFISCTFNNKSDHVIGCCISWQNCDEMGKELVRIFRWVIIIIIFLNIWKSIHWHPPRRKSSPVGQDVICQLNPSMHLASLMWHRMQSIPWYDFGWNTYYKWFKRHFTCYDKSKIIAITKRYLLQKIPFGNFKWQ